MKWPWSAPSPAPRFNNEPDPVAATDVLCIAVLAVKFPDESDTFLHWAWTTGDDETWVLGAALKTVREGAVVVGKTVLRIEVASGAEVGSPDA
jgi:hypothetical protein